MADNSQIISQTRPMLIRQKSTGDEMINIEKNEDDDDENIYLATSIPLPIQTFLWRQTR